MQACVRTVHVRNVSLLYGLLNRGEAYLAYLANARARLAQVQINLSINAQCVVVGDAPAGSTVLGAEPGLSQSMAEASSDGLAGLPAILSGALPPDT